MTTAMVVLLVTASFLNGQEAGSDQRLSNLASLKGEWWLAGTADERRRDVGHTDIRMVIGDAGAVVLKVGELKTNQGSFKATGLQATERAIDLQLDNGKLFLGLYRLGDDGLVFCFAEPGQSRPNSLAPKGTQWAEHWKRVDP